MGISCLIGIISVFYDGKVQEMVSDGSYTTMWVNHTLRKVKMVNFVFSIVSKMFCFIVKLCFDIGSTWFF